LKKKVARRERRFRAYAEIEIGPYGHFFDLWIDRNKKISDTAWSAASTSPARAIRCPPATIEMSTAAPEIVSALAAGAHLPSAYSNGWKSAAPLFGIPPGPHAVAEFHAPKPSGS